jgi:predicted RNA-binding Zn-ribbon protein involved in translation (DUF1610 family)
MTKITQLCNACNKGVEVDNEYKLQACPTCGKPIKPCTVCRTKDKGDFFDGCKRDCPFKSEYAKALGKWNQKNATKTCIM